jgi:biotin carboxyl carrier protein
VKVEVVVNGRAAKLDIEANRLRYAREDGAAMEREFSLESLVPGSFSVLIAGRSYEVIAAGGEIRVNGRAFSVEVFDPREMRGRKSSAAGEGRLNIAAMMPGKVVRLLVTPGAAIEKGQGLVVVEAMKMQNEMKSPKAGRVIEEKTRADATVAAGEVLMVIE